MEKEIRAAYARMGLRSEEEMIAEEEITWKEAESAKQQQEEELDKQAAEDEDEARLAAHLDHEYTLDTSEWDQANPRDYGTPSPVRRWRDDLMAKRERDEEEENRIIQCAEDNEDEKLLEDRKELGENPTTTRGSCASFCPSGATTTCTVSANAASAPEETWRTIAGMPTSTQ